MEAAGADRRAALAAEEALGMVRVAQSVHTFTNDGVTAFVAGGSEVFSEVFFTEHLAFLLHEATVNEWLLAVGVGASEVVGAPLLLQS